MNLDVTIVWQRNWDAIHAVNPDGTRKYRYIINRGSSRSSKTFSLIDCFDLYARQNVNKRLTVWRDTKTDCRKTVLQDVLRHLKSTGRYKVAQDYNKTESIFSYTTGSSFEIHGTDDEETVHGLTQSCAWFNEPYKIPRETFDQIDQRTSDFVFIDYNPKKGHWVEDLMKDPRALVIHSTFKDNPFCPAESRLKILSYQPVSRSEAVESGAMTETQAFEYDLVGNPSGLSETVLNELIRCRENHVKNTANDFNWSVYGLGEKAERPHRIFKWNPISIEEYRKIETRAFIGNDWGKVDPWAIVECKYKDGCLYVRQLNYLSENDLRTRMTPTELAQISGDDDGIVTYTYDRMNVSKNTEIVCDTNRPTKISALRRRGYQAFGSPSKKILDGIDVLHNLQVFYTSDSTDIEYEQENYCYSIGNDGSILEEPEDVNNHTMDAIRYVALYLQIRGIIKKL